MTTASVTLLFSDGVARRLDVEPGARLIEAAAEAGAVNGGSFPNPLAS